MAIITNENSSSHLINSKSQIALLWQQDPMQIIVMLFDKTLLHISRARASLTGWGDENYQACILNAVEVLQQLNNTLNPDSDIAVATHLNDLYQYTSRLLLDSIYDQNLAGLTSASSLLIEIRESLSVFVKNSPQLLQH